MSMTTAQKMMELFTGLDRAYGEYINGTVPDAKGKIKGKATTITQPVTIDVWTKHIQGLKGLGIIPIRSDSTCAWGAIDIDVYTNFDIYAVEAKIIELGLPLVVCRSKSGGAHLYCFTSEPVPAKLMRTKLGEIAAGLGYPGIEIFPKQDELKATDQGNWINICYYKAEDTERYCIHNGKHLKIGEFLHYANKSKITEEQLNSLEIHVEEYFTDGPPCLQHLAKVGFTGDMNNALFSIGVYYKNRNPEDGEWQELIAEANEKWMTPGTQDEVDGIIKRLESTDYYYKCKDAPLKSHCNKGECRKRKFGVGPDNTQLEGADDCFPKVDFPMEIFPPYFKSLVKNYSKALHCNEGFMAMNFLTVLSGIAGNAVTVMIKRSWFTPLFLWFGVVDKTGSGKTHPQKAAMLPVEELQVQAYRWSETAQMEYKAALADYNKDKKTGTPPAEPAPMRHYYTQNFTIESLIPMFKQSARGLVIHVDELAGLLKGMGQYKSGKNSDEEQFLQLFNCGPLKSDRVTKNGFCGESGAAVLGGIQSEVFKNVFGDREAANGMLYRFLPMALNGTPPLFSENEISDESEDQWQSIIDWTRRIPAEVDPITGHIIKQVLRVDKEGKALFIQFHDWLSQVQPYMPHRFEGYLPKLKTYCLKFMGLLHLLECHKDGQLTDVISAETVAGAIAMTRFFAGEALQLMKENGAVVDPHIEILNKAIEALRGTTEGGKVPLTMLREKMNEYFPVELRLKETQNKKIGTLLREININVIEGPQRFKHIILPVMNQ